MSELAITYQDENSQTNLVTQSETILIEVEDTPTQFIDIIQEDQQVVVVTEDSPTVLEFVSEGLRGPSGPAGPPGPAGPDLNIDLEDLTLLFENKLV